MGVVDIETCITDQSPSVFPVGFAARNPVYTGTGIEEQPDYSDVTEPANGTPQKGLRYNLGRSNMPVPGPEHLQHWRKLPCCTL